MKQFFTFTESTSSGLRPVLVNVANITWIAPVIDAELPRSSIYFVGSKHRLEVNESFIEIDEALAHQHPKAPR
jgi:hypothetical protein